MKILDEAVVTQYYIEFDETETALLKMIGILPPHAEPRARLWSTKDEIEETKAILARAKETVS
jgi:hypothetical protein